MIKMLLRMLDQWAFRASRDRDSENIKSDPDLAKIYEEEDEISDRIDEMIDEHIEENSKSSIHLVFGCKHCQEGCIPTSDGTMIAVNSVVSKMICALIILSLLSTAISGTVFLLCVL